MADRVCPCVSTTHTNSPISKKEKVVCGRETNLSSKISDLLRAVVVHAYIASVGALRYLPVWFWDWLRAAGRGWCFRLMARKVWNFHAIIRRWSKMGSLVRILGYVRAWRGWVLIVLFLNAGLILMVLEHDLHLWIIRLCHGERPRLVGKRHDGGCMRIVKGRTVRRQGSKALNMSSAGVARDVAMSRRKGGCTRCRRDQCSLRQQ
jgi:hypothetical protein